MPIDKLKDLFRAPGRSNEETVEMIDALDHFEIARLLHQLALEEKIRLFKSLKTDKKRQELLYGTDIDSRGEIILSLGHEFMAGFLETMPEDEATDILKELSPEMQEKILDGMVPREAYSIKNLIRFKEETAGGMMNPNFNKVHKEQMAGNIMLQIKRETAKDPLPYYFVVDDNNKLIGFFKLRDLLNVSANLKATQIIRERTPKVFLEDTCEKVANLMDHENLSAVPVVDKDEIIQGIVTFDDVIRVIQDTASEDIYTMVGTAKVDPFAKKTFNKIIARAPWLATTFIGGFISAWLLHAFKLTLAEFTTVILFIPFVLGLAGNVGIQGGTVIVRGLATGDIQIDNLKTVVLSEIKVGSINGLIFGALCGLAITFTNHFWMHASGLLGLTVGLGIVLAVAMASLVGSLMPLIFFKMDIDPAISTGPMITVLNDILGLFIYLSATALLI